MEIYDCIIIGGGPAGATAAIYLARFNRKVLVLDKKQGRSSYPQINENYFGFPEGIHARQLRELGKKQAERFGAEFVFDDVENVSKKDDLFEIISKNGKYFSKTLIIATGVKDEFPHFKGYEHCIGISLFWCITCDGHRTIDKDIAIIGHDNEAATTAMQFLNYTKKVCFINNSPNFKCEISEEKKRQMKENGIKYFDCGIKKVHDNNGLIHSIELDTGDTIKSDFMFSMQGAIPSTEIFKDLKLKCTDLGYIKVSVEQRTNVPFCYAAGDVSDLFSHQVVSAAHEGSMAAQAANYDLYRPEQRD